MSGRIKYLCCFILLIGIYAGAAVGQSECAAIDLIPSDAVICLEIVRPGEVLDLLTGEKMTETVTSMPFYQKLQSSQGFLGFRYLVSLMETRLETPWRQVLKKLTSGGIILAVCPDATVLLVMDGQDEKLLNQVHEMLIEMVQADAQDKGKANPVESAEIDGVKIWSFNGKEAHAVVGGRLIFANNPDGLKALLNRASAKDGESFASNLNYQNTKKAAGADTAARAYMNMQVIKSIPDIAKLLSQDKTNPLAALFFSGIIETVRNSSRLGMGLDVDGNGLLLRTFIDGKAMSPEGKAVFAQPVKPEEGVLENLNVPRRIAAFSFYRDLYGFYSAKDELFPERTSQLIFFENMMGIFFSGRNLTDEVLVEIKPEIRFVAAEQQYDEKRGIPQVQIPAFAAIFRLRDAKEFDEVVEEAWQKAIGLVNFTRGQQAMPGLIIDRPVHNGIKFTLAYFSTAGLEETTNLHTRFNFRPSLAMPEDYLVISSTDELARDLIDALTAEARGSRNPMAGISNLVELDGKQLGSVLKANYNALVRNNMLKEGSTEKEAQGSIDIFIMISNFVKNMKFSIGMQQDLTEARLNLELNIN